MFVREGFYLVRNILFRVLYIVSFRTLFYIFTKPVDTVVYRVYTCKIVTGGYMCILYLKDLGFE